MYIPCSLTPQQFSYWLQGAIEIGGLTRFTQNQLKTIVRRIAEMGEIDSFCYAVFVTIASCAGREDVFPVINKTLQAKFLHEIDPTYEGDQGYLLAVHRGEAEPEARP